MYLLFGWGAEDRSRAEVPRILLGIRDDGLFRFRCSGPFVREGDVVGAIDAHGDMNSSCYELGVL